MNTDASGDPKYNETEALATNCVAMTYCADNSEPQANTPAVLVRL